MKRFLCLLLWYTSINTQPRKILDSYHEAIHSGNKNDLEAFISHTLHIADQLTQGMIFVCQKINDGPQNQSRADAINTRLPSILAYYKIIQEHIKKEPLGEIYFTKTMQQFEALKKICEEENVSISFKW